MIWWAIGVTLPAAAAGNPDAAAISTVCPLIIALALESLNSIKTGFPAESSPSKIIVPLIHPTSIPRMKYAKKRI
jgi:hypothetical protein